MAALQLQSGSAVNAADLVRYARKWAGASEDDNSDSDAPESGSAADDTVHESDTGDVAATPVGDAE